MKRISKSRRKPLTDVGRLRIGLSLAWLFLLLLLMITGSCTQTDVEEDVIPPHALKDVEAGFNLNVLATRPPVTRSITFTPDGTIESDTLSAGLKDSLLTKATDPLSGELESKIASLWVGQYDAKTGQRLFSQFLSPITSTTVNLKLKQSQNKSESHVYFISNVDDLGEIADEATLKKLTLDYLSTDVGLPNNGLCKMMGMWDGEVFAGGVKDVTVNLTRLLAKITFTYSMGEGFTFTPDSVKLINAPTASQVEAPTGQLTGIHYTNYIGTADSKGATVYWYLPENMAGTATGVNAVDSEKKKIGTGVKNATCIELTGDAVQGGVTYKDVTFRFYPGSNHNNYNILRNAHYTMDVKLVGIDVSDERITVGEIPDIEVDPTEMPAKKGGEKEIQITARPGQEWVFDMPEWLSALLDGDSIPSGAAITHQGPAMILFKAVDANPYAEERIASFEIDINNKKQKIEITQSGSTLTKGADITLRAEADSEGSSIFTATEGLQCMARLEGGDGWLNWSDSGTDFSGMEAPAEAQILKVKSLNANPLAQMRRGKIVVKAGTSIVNNEYINLKQEINVEQQGSTVTGSTVTVSAEAGSSQSSFTATAGLEWALSVANGDWISLRGATSGSPTSANAQTVNFSTTVNPKSTQRSGEIIVQVGDKSEGPTGKITVNQEASSLAASIVPVTLAATAGETGTYTMKGTKGLPYSFTAGFPSWLTVTDGTALVGGGTTTGTDQRLTYTTASVNPNENERKATVTVQVGDMTKDVEIMQEGSIFSITNSAEIIAAKGGSTTDSIIATPGLEWAITSSTINGITVSPTFGAGTTSLTFQVEENTGVERIDTFIVSVKDANPERTATITITQEADGAYADYLQVCKQDGVPSTIGGAIRYCNDLVAEGKDDWYLPSLGELRVVYQYKSSLELLNDFEKFTITHYWSTSANSGGRYYVLYFRSGITEVQYEDYRYYFRCVRKRS